MDKKEQSVVSSQAGGWRAHWILIVTTLLFAICFMDRMLLSVVLQPMKMELGLSDSVAGIVMTVFTLAVAMLAFPVSYIADIWSRKKAMSVMAMIWSTATFVTGFAKSFMGVIIPTAFIAGGQAAFSAAGTAMITGAYPKEKHGRVLGILNSASPIGVALGMVLGGIISVKYGWRTPFFMCAVPGVILGIAVLFLKDYKTIRTVDSSGKQANFIQCAGILLRIPTIRWFLVGYAMLMILGNAMMAWLPSFVMREINVKENVAGSISALSGIMSLVGVFGGGIISDYLQKKSRRSRLLIPAASSVVAGAFMLGTLFLLKINFSLFIVTLVLCSIAFYIGVPSLATVSQEVVPPSLKGSSYGLMVFSMYALGGGWSPWLIGVISDLIGDNGLKYAWAMACAGPFIAAILFFMGSKHYIKDVDNVKDTVLEV